MKNLYFFLISAFLITGINSCTKTDSKTALCSNGILDGGETEIDCGAACQACPASAVVTCTVGNSSFVSTNPSNTYGQQLAYSIRIYGNDSRPLNFMFVPAPVGQPTPISSVSFTYNGEAYIIEPGDSGKVILTANDTLRKIASGTFWFTAGRVTGPDTTSVRNGVFTNVRYNH